MENVKKSIKLKKELDLLRPLTKEDELRVMQKFRLDWNFHSNNLEGNSLTYGETKALILHGITAQGKPLKDHFEITGHNEAVKWIEGIVKEERPLTENFIRELHKLLLKESYKSSTITPSGIPAQKEVKVGEYKTTPNHVLTKTGEIFRFATPEETPALMADLMQWYRKKSEEKDTNAILLATEFHYKFIRIHPFDDGNGRTARILMNFILMRFGYPPVIIKTEDKENYFAALQQADAGLLEAFIEYIAQNLNHSLVIMIKGAKGESVEEPDDLDKEIALLEQKLKTVAQPIEISKSKESILDVYDNSISKLFEKFIKKGELFENFYSKHGFYFLVDGRSMGYSKENIIPYRRNTINENTNFIMLEFEYNTLKKAGFQALNHKSRITFQFNFTRYNIETLGGLTYEKLYGEQLTEEEISELVSSEIRRHKQAIEAKIDEINNQK